MTSSLILAATIFFKPFGFIFIPYYLVRRQFKMVGFFTLFLIVLAIAPAIFFGFSNLQGQYQNWFFEISAELAKKQTLLENANHSIFSILARYTPLRLIDFTPELTKIYQLIVTSLIGIFFLFLYFKGKDIERRFVLESAFIMGLIPALSYTSYNAYGFMELAVLLIVINYRQLPKWTRIVAIVGFVFSAINMFDLVGRKNWVILNDISLIAVGALILMIVLSIIRFRKIA